MKLEKTIVLKTHTWFIVFFLFMLAAFWLTYFTRIGEQENYRMHLHGLIMVLWCCMLVVQPWLIRTKRKAIHKQTGRLSYVLVPLLIFSTIDLLKYRLPEPGQLGTMEYIFIPLVLHALYVFILFYGLAIYHRKNTMVHARYMVCTAFPFFTPITDRIIGIYFPSILQYFPTIEGRPVEMYAGFALADILLVGLSIWDWRSHRRWNIFPFALAVLLVYHYSVLNFYRFDWWKSYCNWFAGL